MPARPYARVSLGKDSSGRPLVINARTKAMLDAASGRTMRLTIVQGSYMDNGAKASAATHKGGGVVDIRTWDLRRGVTPRRAVRRLRRRAGFAAWYRKRSQGFDPHIHAVAIGDRELDPSAARQVQAYRRGLNGLSGRSEGPDDGPRVPIRTWEEIQALPVVSLSKMKAAWARDRKRRRGLHPIQTRRVQRALGFTLRTGRWGKPTRARFGARGPTEDTLRELGKGRFRVVD